MTHSIDHLNLVVRDLETTVRFYRDLLGFQQTNRATLQGDWIDAVAGLPGIQAEVVFLELPGNGPRIEVLQYLTPIGQNLPANSLANTFGLRHFALRISDMTATVARLRAAGVQFVGNPVEVPAGILKGSNVRKTLCYFHDPDGVLLELAEYHE
ncbi:MAG: hypothetical protein B9S32_16135 [Verrucomicrobia bacterium Tous-C9LFEB]|nr:MAG: hypothetical protein B9S32_16135 [Verrucomicrobia bacterium Tous-C9LFEB]